MQTGNFRRRFASTSSNGWGEKMNWISSQSSLEREWIEQCFNDWLRTDLYYWTVMQKLLSIQNGPWRREKKLCVNENRISNANNNNQHHWQTSSFLSPISWFNPHKRIIVVDSLFTKSTSAFSVALLEKLWTMVFVAVINLFFFQFVINSIWLFGIMQHDCLIVALWLNSKQQSISPADCLHYSSLVFSQQSKKNNWISDGRLSWQINGPKS